MVLQSICCGGTILFQELPVTGGGGEACAPLRTGGGGEACAPLRPGGGGEACAPPGTGGGGEACVPPGGLAAP